MARFRGIVKSGRGESTRLGHTSTGLSTHCNGWDGGIAVYAGNSNGTQPGADRFVVYVTGGSNQGIGDYCIGELIVLDGGRRLVWKGDNRVAFENGAIARREAINQTQEA